MTETKGNSKLGNTGIVEAEIANSTSSSSY